MFPRPIWSKLPASPRLTHWPNCGLVSLSKVREAEGSRQPQPGSDQFARRIIHGTKSRSLKEKTGRFVECSQPLDITWKKLSECVTDLCSRMCPEENFDI